MSPFNLSSASSQVRTSHYLQPLSKTDTQTSNFARSGGGRLRDSLRRIPSSLSARSKRELEGDAPRKRKQSKASKEALSVISDTSRDSSLQKAQDLPISPSITTAQSQPAGKTKSKTKTRRVLAEIISWGNSFHSSSKSTAPITKISAPQPLRSNVAKLPIQTPAAAQTASLAVDSEPLRAAIDPRVPVKITKVLVKKPSSRQIHSNSSRSGLSSTSSTQSAMENLRRPSMGPDPFRRHDQGAELVEHVIRHGVKRVPPKSTERKESFSSKDALSRMSPESDDLSTADVASKCPRHILTSSFLASIQDEGPPQKRHVSAPLPSKGVLVDLPPRIASLGCALDAIKALPSPVALPEPAGESTILAATSSYVLVPDYLKTMKKEKTKSKVWGMLTRGKSTKNKTESNDAVPVALLNKEESKLAFQQTVKAASFEPSVPQEEPNGKESHISSKRPTPPNLGLMSPFNDQQDLLSQLSESTAISAVVPSQPAQLTSDGGSSFIEVSMGTADSSGSTDRSASIISDRPPTKGPQPASFRVRPKGVPKRKSLTGLFDLAITKSFDRAKSASPLVPHFVNPLPVAFASAVEVEEQFEAHAHTEQTADSDFPALQGASRFISRLGEGNRRFERNMLQGYADLHRVASATDKLSSLVSRFDFSLDASPTPVVRKRSSRDSLSRNRSSDSPTPMRRVRSELLTAKPRASSAIAGGSTISPLKLALHRAQAAAYCPDKPSLASQRAAFEIQTSLVSKGMRNIFAPAPPSQSSPQQPRLGSHIEMIPEDAPPCSSSADLTAAEGARESMRKIARPRLVQERQSARSPSTVTDVPHDLLQAVIGNSDNVPKLSTPLSQVSQMMLGLPTEPPVVRISPRRPARQPPAVALLGDVMLSIQYAESEEVDESRPGIAFDLANDIATRDSILSEVSSTNVDDLRASFDFTAEYARLDRGEQRASFVEALREASSADALKGEKVPKLSSIAPATATPTDAGGAVATFLSLRSSVNHHIAIRGKSVADGGTSTEAVRDGSRYRPDPFKGQLAFQQHVSQARDSKGRAFSQSAPPCELAYQAPVHPRRRGHKRGESGLSIATMSSFGAVIETGIAGDYVNHFEANFAEHLNTASIVTADSVDAISQVCVLVSPTDLLSLDSVENDEREAAQKTRHSRTLSVQSVESVLGLEHDSVTDRWSVSMSNSRRSSSISRNRRSGSTDSAFGRADWASYKRKSSTRSDTSNISASSTSRLGRPGVGERMFQLDKSVQLSSIAGSPSDEPAPSKDMLTWPFDPLLEQQAAIRTSSIDSDSVFGGHASGRQSGLILKGLRPGSLVSTVSSSEDPDDTFVNLRKYAKHLASPKAESKEPCLQAEGEDKSMMSHVQMTQLDGNSGQQMLGSSIDRPRKPASAHRRRPAKLNLAYLPMDTPGLTSPSESETSSRMSLDTKISDPFSESSETHGRPHGLGHYRQKSSAVVKLEATIREEPSTATLRPARNTSDSPGRLEPEVVSWDAEEESGGVQVFKSWLEWQREAGDECRRVRDDWVDSEESKNAVAGQSPAFSGIVDPLTGLEDFRLPMTNEEIADFLAKSSEIYKPLDQLPIGRYVHHRKSSLCDARLLTSPYGLPLPKPPQPNKPKTSLITKFERTNSSTSSNISFGGEDPPLSAPPAPPSAVFAQFARERPTNPPPQLVPMALSSPFKLPNLVALVSVEESEQVETDGKAVDKRPHVSPDARRQALGWGRRRNSDGPTKMKKKVRMFEGVPLATAIFQDVNIPRSIAAWKSSAAVRSSNAVQDRENAVVTMRSTRKRIKSTSRTAAKRTAAAQPRSLRV